MAGGLMQLVAYGAQDVYLTGNPQITFFKVVYRRHTNFSIEAHEETFNGNPGFGNKAQVKLERQGDLVTKMYLKTTLNALTGTGSSNSGKVAWVRRVGHALIKEVQLNIGGSEIDEQYGDWMNIWYELSRDINKDDGYNQMIGNTPDLTTLQ